MVEYTTWLSQKRYVSLLRTKKISSLSPISQFPTAKGTRTTQRHASRALRNMSASHGCENKRRYCRSVYGCDQYCPQSTSLSNNMNELWCSNNECYSFKVWLVRCDTDTERKHIPGEERVLCWCIMQYNIEHCARLQPNTPGTLTWDTHFTAHPMHVYSLKIHLTWWKHKTQGAPRITDYIQTLFYKVDPKSNAHYACAPHSTRMRV
jgi:hypothetical protein